MPPNFFAIPPNTTTSLFEEFDEEACNISFEDGGDIFKHENVMESCHYLLSDKIMIVIVIVIAMILFGG
jgi:hypothetical protein